ncbi:DUF969 domain-containing protein [Romboutsia sp. Marseille-P6047]|uniref:DUF969 domain-containing protein n=1 Tax=Romboutsia sp. Marseille-P6047 TaxID=2161817 RepID=UPI000F05A8CA|nr:DUF969 domain-containing protein [Romboutsia sp. Marseille-P6047]
MELIGILIIIIGFALKLDTIAVVVSAGIATGLVANMSITETLSTLGEAFITNRTTCLFMLTVPIIGLCERYGLKAKAIMLIKKASNLSTGILLSGYTLIREATIAMGVTLGGHPQFVRPLVSPMAEGAAIAKYGELDEEDLDKIRAYSAASDNIGNFYGQNIFMANAGILLIASTLEGLGMNVDTLQLAKVAIPVGVLAIILWVCQNRLLDRKLKKKYMSRKNNVGGAE